MLSCGKLVEGGTLASHRDRVIVFPFLSHRYCLAPHLCKLADVSDLDILLNTVACDSNSETCKV